MTSKRILAGIFLGWISAAACWGGPAPAAPAASANGLVSSDLYKFRSTGAVAFSPDGRRIAYTIIYRDRPGRPYGQIWVMDVATRHSTRVGGEQESTGDPLWSPDGQWIAYFGSEAGHGELKIAHPDGSAATGLAAVEGTNAPLPHEGSAMTWSPDGKRIAFVSATPGPETATATGDPMVFTRYLWRPTAGEGINPWNDNRRLHIFVVDIATKLTRQLTRGDRYEHSIDWSPDGGRILFLSNHDPNADEFFHYDVFALDVADGSIHRLTATEACDYVPTWSPDGKSIAYLGTKRGLTDRETTMEDTHAWVMNADGANPREIGAAIDDRQGDPEWAADGTALYFTVQERGSVHLVRLPVSGPGASRPEAVVDQPGAVGGFSVARNGDVAYSYESPRDMAELFLQTGGQTTQLTDLNAEVLQGKQIARVVPFSFISNDNKYTIEAFLTEPLGLAPGTKHPLIVDIHGGPHGQNGPGFDFLAQVFAAQGWGTLRVNYRGSTGYGQKFADAVFGDQDGDEGQDVLYAVSAACRRYLWIDRDRMGIEGVSYGGQLTFWLITQTNEFKAAIPFAGITNLISYNYLTYYNQYEEMEFGQFFTQGDLMDTAWKRSALRYVAQVHTPTLIMHGANDPDVPIPDAEQFYIALKDVGVETEFVMYPREGHGARETKHQVDRLDRSIAWYKRHFPPPDAKVFTNVQP
ncbi:MAG TPA: S9 family peptidase [Candidatus Acidoferrales bacterium]|nr:S9 family peptidase [Candidatus Acidoferrales bacterium]